MKMIEVCIRDDDAVRVLPFRLGDRVRIDASDICGVVVGIAIYPHEAQFQVSWFNNGALAEHWISGWRLEANK
jgi:hypothetical protein